MSHAGCGGWPAYSDASKNIIVIWRVKYQNSTSEHVGYECTIQSFLLFAELDTIVSRDLTYVNCNMYNTPRKAGGGRTYASPQKVPLKKGLFVDGIWHCKTIHTMVSRNRTTDIPLSGNCEPRLPASHFQVRKDGPNRGRWFYTCQESKDSGCGFFLWDTDAAPREIKSVINNSRSEPDAAFKTPADAARDDRLNKNTVEGHIAASNQWIKQFGGQEEDEFGDWPLSAQDEKDLLVAETTLTAPSAHDSTPVTPHKVAKTAQYMTPGTKRKYEDTALPTPQSGNLYNKPNTLATSKSQGTPLNEGTTPSLLSPSTTPTPARYRDISSSETHGTSTDYDITTEVMSILQTQNIDDETSQNLRDTLNRHALKTSGIAKGRDISRLALKTKDAKIVELQQRISALETEREMDKVVIRNIKGDITRSISSRRGRGRGRGGQT